MQYTCMSKTLRPYQELAAQGTLAHWERDPSCRVLIAMPTGAGKTETAAAIIERVRAKAPLAVVHTNVLVEQTRRRLAHIPNLRVTTIQALLPEETGQARRESFADADLVWADEAHHLAADEWGQAASSLPRARKLGTSATPTTALGSQFDELIAPVTYQELLAAGNLVPCDVYSPAERLGKGEAPDMVRAYLEHGKREDGSWRPGIYTARTVAACQEAADRLRAQGVRCAVVTGTTPQHERGRAFSLYATGELDMLLSPMVIAEGFDSPRAEVLVADRGFGELITYLQYCGRVLRPFQGKERALVIDGYGASLRHGLPTDNRVYSLRHGTQTPAQAQRVLDDELAEKEQDEAARVAQRFALIRDTLADRLAALQQLAEERGYSPGFVFHRFREQTGIEIPRRFEARFRSVCIHCRHRVQKGEPILWAGSGQVMHPDCWLQSVQQGTLDAVAKRMKLSD